MAGRINKKSLIFTELSPAGKAVFESILKHHENTLNPVKVILAQLIARNTERYTALDKHLKEMGIEGYLTDDDKKNIEWTVLMEIEKNIQTVSGMLLRSQVSVVLAKDAKTEKREPSRLAQLMPKRVS